MNPLDKALIDGKIDGYELKEIDKTICISVYLNETKYEWRISKLEISQDRFVNILVERMDRMLETFLGR